MARRSSSSLKFWAYALAPNIAPPTYTASAPAPSAASKTFVGTGRSQQFYVIRIQSLSSNFYEKFKVSSMKTASTNSQLFPLCMAGLNLQIAKTFLHTLIKEKRNHLSNPSCYYFSISSSSFSSSFTLPSRRFFSSRASCSFFCASSICIRREISSCFRSYIS